MRLQTLITALNIMFTISPRRSLYHCNYCQKDISSCPRIKCAVCTDFDLCLECFAVGCEITPHKRDHDYRIIDNLNFPIYHPEWGVSAVIVLRMLPLLKMPGEQTSSDRLEGGSCGGVGLDA